MAVLCEALSVVVRRDAIEDRFAGGWSEFVHRVPNGTLCYEDELARVGFMNPDHVGDFLLALAESGLNVMTKSQFVDAAVVDQVNGPTLPTDWLEFGRLPCDDSGNRVSACWLYEEPRVAAGLHFKGREITLAMPVGWSYDNSISKEFVFVKTEDKGERLKFLRRDDGADFFLDTENGKEVSLPRTSGLE